jgi:hypothetical protein
MSVDQFINEAIQYSRTLYRPEKTGALVVQGDLPPNATVLITEHRPFEARQYRVQVQKIGAVGRTLPAGEYSISVAVPGHEPYREHVQVQAGQTSRVKVNLQPIARPPVSFEQVHAKYGVQRDSQSLRKLTVPPQTKVVLDPKSPEFSLDIQQIDLKTIDQVKKVLGHSDEKWLRDHARFGGLTPGKPPAAKMEQSTPALMSAYNEYVYGNSASVANWTAALNNWIIANPVSIGIFLFLWVDVGPGSTLYIGSQGLVCGTLRVHATGTVQVSGDGPMNIEMLVFEEYF